jgi:hypothetical protein
VGEQVQVAVRLRDGTTEQLTAEPLGQNRFRLVASSFLVPLAHGDLVMCHDEAGAKRVVGVLPCDAVLTVFQPAEGTDHAGLDALVALWEATGAGATQGGGPFLVTTWPRVPLEAVAQQLNGDEDAGRGTWILAAEQHERSMEQQGEIDFGSVGTGSY